MKKTIEYLKKAAQHNVPSALYQLGREFEKGVLVRKNSSEALNHYLSAASLGDGKSRKRILKMGPVACFKLAKQESDLPGMILQCLKDENLGKEYIKEVSLKVIKRKTIKHIQKIFDTCNKRKRIRAYNLNPFFSRFFLFFYHYKEKNEPQPSYKFLISVMNYISGHLKLDQVATDAIQPLMKFFIESYEGSCKNNELLYDNLFKLKQLWNLAEKANEFEDFKMDFTLLKWSAAMLVKTLSGNRYTTNTRAVRFEEVSKLFSLFVVVST